MRILLLCLAALLTSCGQHAPNAHSTGVYMLLDTSGTYRVELTKAKQIINYTLSRLGPMDTFAVARIDTASFSEKDIIAKTTLEDRPTAANRQKRRFAERIDKFSRTTKSSQYTDISGGLLQAIEFLNEKNPGKKTIFIFSDLKEELSAGYIRDIPLELDGFNVVAINVTKLRSDNVDPREYTERLNQWASRVADGGGTWRVINDLDHLESLLAT